MKMINTIMSKEDKEKVKRQFELIYSKLKEQKEKELGILYYNELLNDLRNLLFVCGIIIPTEYGIMYALIRNTFIAIQLHDMRVVVNNDGSVEIGYD